MPINPLYQFIDEPLDVEGKNQFLNFLRQDAQRNGMSSNYQGDLSEAQARMNYLDSQQPQAPQEQMAPRAPMPQVARQPMPQAPRTMPQTRMQPQQVEAPEQPSLPIAPIDKQPVAEMSLERQPQQQALPSQAMQTTLARKVQEGGYDPRLLYSALAQFSGEFGNYGGKPTESSAPQFLEAQLALEKQKRDEAYKQQQAVENRQLRQQEMSLRYAPKPVDPEMKLKYEMIKNQSDSIKAKTQVEQELNDPNSSRTRALRQAYEMSTGQKLPEGVSGSDIYRIMPMTSRSIESEKGRDFQAEQGALNRAAMAERAKTGGNAMRNANELRKEYQNNATTKASRDVRVQWNKVKEVMDNPSPAGDMAAIFMFMKALDPGSTVREGEYKSAAEATSALGRAETYANNIKSGQKLNPQQRSDFKKIMQKFYDSQMREQSKVNANYKALAERNGMSVQDLMLEGEEQQNEAAQSKQLGVRGLPVWQPE